MPSLHNLLDIFLHLDKHLRELAPQYGPWIYGLLFAIVFCETGLVVTPFLPGDSLLFAVGALLATDTLGPVQSIAVLLVAAILGDTVNYQIGHFLGPKVLTSKSRLLKQEYLDRTHRFFEKYGGKTIILARFVPIVRTFAPFVAGVGSMTYSRFLAYNVSGGVLWVALLVGAGCLFGKLPFVQAHFGVVEIAIIIISVLPAAWEYLRYKHTPQAARSDS